MLGDYKYESLMDYFKNLETAKVKLSYGEIEKIIGFNLPKSAYKYRAYWSESKTHTITRSWIVERQTLVRSNCKLS